MEVDKYLKRLSAEHLNDLLFELNLEYYDVNNQYRKIKKINGFNYNFLPEYGKSVADFFFFKLDESKIDKLKKSYRAKAKLCHPDLGGSNELMKELNEVYNSALERLERVRSV